MKYKLHHIIILIFLSVILLNIKRIQFEYYTWNLSSEEIGTRDKSVENIVGMGDYAVPLLIKKINNPYIFETHLEVFCLELITKAKTSYNKNNFHLESEAIPFWNNWWFKNKHKY